MITEKSFLWGAFKTTSLANAKPKITPDESRIITQLAKEFEDRSRKDIDTWRDAISAASDPNTPKWAPLQDLYTELSIDGHLGGEIALRKAAVKSTRFYIADSVTGEEDPVKTKFFKKKWFYKLMDDVLDAQFKGFTIMELVNPSIFKFKLIPRRFCVPQQGLVLTESGGTSGINYLAPENANYVFEVVSSDFGILNDIVPQLIWKRNAQQTWAEFSEKFGIPLVTVETNKSDKKDLDRIEAMLNALGQSWSGIIPEGSTLTIHDVAGKSDPYNIWDRQIDRCNSEISKRILSGTMVTDNGSSRSQSEVHERNLDDKISEEDRLLIEFTFEDIKALLIANGAPISDTDELIFDRTEAISMSDHWTIIQGLLDKYDIDEKWISKRFGGVPLTVKKEVAGGAKPANFKKPSALLAGGVMAISLPNYTAPSCCAEHDRFPEAVTNPQIKALQALSEAMAEATYKRIKARALVAQKTALFGNILRDGLTLEWKRVNDKSTKAALNVDIAYDAPDYRALGMMELNLFHFSFARNLAELERYNQLLIDGNNVRSYPDFIEAVKKTQTLFNESYARTEYNLAVAVGQNASTYLTAMHDIDTISYVRYQTIGDELVRDEHKVLNNRVFSLHDSQARRIWPPNGYNCRCEMLQEPGQFNPEDRATGTWAIQQLSAGKKDSYAKQFLVNRCEIGKVFTENQFYTKNKIEDFSKDIADISYTDFNLEKSDKIRSKIKKSLKYDNRITEENKDKLFTGDKVMQFSDYLGRKMAMDRKTFDKHTSGDYISNDKRHQLFPHLKKVIEEPDEVYFLPYATDNYLLRYIKHYKDISLVVDSEFRADKINIKTWYPLKDENKRSGLLIKQNP